MLFNFNNDYDLLPRTYSIKSYRRRESSIAKKLVKYLVFLLVLLAIAAIAFLFFIL